MAGRESWKALLESAEARTLKSGKGESEFNEFTDPFVSDWKRARSLIEHEDELIHQRTTWLLSINAFLFTGFFLSQKSDSSADIIKISSWVIPFAGAVISWSIMIAITAAVKQLVRIEEWWVLRKQLDPRNFVICGDDCDNFRHPQIVGFREKGEVPHDFMISKALPGLIIVVWLVMFVGYFWKYLSADLSLPRWTIIFLIVALLLITYVIVWTMRPKMHNKME